MENSIKHGLTPKEGEQVLKVRISKKESSVCIIVEDNGVGRHSKKNNGSVSAGQGLLILDRIIDIHRKLNKKNISYKIIDLDAYELSGTRVEINLEI